jgi:hypothetical protein
MLAGKPRQVYMVLQHHYVTNLEAVKNIIRKKIQVNITVNMLLSPPPAFVTNRFSTPISFITLTGIAF